MSARTPRWGFNAFGAGAPGSITDDAQKFTGADRFLLDKVLASLETRNPAAGPTQRLAAPNAPGVDVATSGGALAAGRTYSYVVTYLGEGDLETLASPAQAITTAPPLVAPGPPSLDIAPGGALAPGGYYYALTTIVDGSESPLGDAVGGQVIDSRATITVITPPELFGPGGSSRQYRIWRAGDNEIGYTKLAVIDAGATYDDDGSIPRDPCACDPGNQPPSAATNAGKSSATITIEALPQGARAWRIYATTTPGSYSAQSLVHTVVETETETGGAVVTSWIDTGAPRTAGSPPTVDQHLAPAPFALAHGDALPEVAPYPEYFPYVVDGALYLLIDGAWALVGAGGSSSAPASSASAPAVTTSPDGSRWVATIDDEGAVVATSTQRPGPPTAVSAIRADGDYITWQPPTLTGGELMEITGYLVEIYGDDGFHQIVSTSPSAVLPITPRLPYVLAVAARNAVGVGRYAEVTVIA